MSGNAASLAWISSIDPPDAFPPVGDAMLEPDGLLAAGGDLSQERLLFAYSHGIFPWYDQGQPILWWSPNPRCVIRPENLHISRRLRRSLKNSRFLITFNSAFEAVISRCAEPRPGQDGTWITHDMMLAYSSLQHSGWAHSVEVWKDDTLVGGMYGLAIGGAFFGESMFSRTANGSKAAMLALCEELRQRDIGLLDCQVVSGHLASLGAQTIPREQFVRYLEKACVAGSQQQFPSGDIRPIGDYLS